MRKTYFFKEWKTHPSDYLGISHVFLRLDTRDCQLFVHCKSDNKQLDENPWCCYSRIKIMSRETRGVLDYLSKEFLHERKELVDAFIRSNNRSRELWNLEISILNEICLITDVSVAPVYARKDYFFIDMRGDFSALDTESL